jgi:integrase/recombinase XerD
MEDLIKRYQVHQEVKGLAVSTIRGNRIRIQIFLDELKERGIEIDKVDIETIRAIVRDRKWRSGTIATWLMVIKPFCTFLAQEGILTKNPLVDIKMKQEKQGRLYFLTDEEMKKVLDVSRLLPLAGQLVIHLLADTGARNHEILGIEIKNINLDKRSIYLEKVKGGEPRYVFFSEETGELMKAHLPNVANGHLFKSNQAWVCKMVRQSVGIAFPNNPEKMNITPHSLRHSFVTSWVRNNGNIRILRNIIGWRSLKMLDRYEHLNEDALKNGYQEYQDNRGAVAALGAK